MLEGIHLVRRGLISADQFVDALERGFAQRPPLGEVAMRLGKLTMRQVFSVLAEQSDRHQPFGRIAVELGFLSEGDLGELLLKQADSTPDVVDMLVMTGVLDRDSAMTALEDFHRISSGRPLRDAAVAISV